MEDTPALKTIELKVILKTRGKYIPRITVLAYNWWSLFVRLADPAKHTESITSRPLLLQRWVNKCAMRGKLG